MAERSKLVCRGEMASGMFKGALVETSRRRPVCIEVEDDTCAGSLAGRQPALRVAGNVLRPYLP